jgi:hypothetical protein
VFFYDAVSGNYVGSLGSLGQNYPVPPLSTPPLYIDVDDGAFEVHCVEAGPKIHVFAWK